MNFWVARARRRARGKGVLFGGRPARRRWCCVTASGICWKGEVCISLAKEDTQQRADSDILLVHSHPFLREIHGVICPCGWECGALEEALWHSGLRIQA